MSDWPEIHHVDKIGCTGVMTLAARAWADIEEAGYGSGYCFFGWEDPAFYAVVECKIVGILVYKKQEHDRSLSAVLGYVLPEYRRQGIYRLLFESLIGKAKELKLQKVAGTIHIDNVDMIAAAISFGRKPDFINYSLDLSPYEEAIHPNNRPRVDINNLPTAADCIEDIVIERGEKQS